MSSIYQSLKVAIIASIFLVATASFARAQSTAANAGGGTVDTTSLNQTQIDEIIRKFSSKEGQFRRALNLYAFKRDALIQGNRYGRSGRRRIPSRVGLYL